MAGRYLATNLLKIVVFTHIGLILAAYMPWVERKVSALEGGEESILFASGMCAATTTFMALLPQGSHLIVTSDCYRRTRQFLEQYLSRMGVETTVIEPSNLEAFVAAIRPNTKFFFTESPTNAHGSSYLGSGPDNPIDLPTMRALRTSSAQRGP